MSIQLSCLVRHVKTRLRPSSVHSGICSQGIPWRRESSLMQVTWPRSSPAVCRAFNSAVLQRSTSQEKIPGASQSLCTKSSSKLVNGIIRSDYWIEDLPHQDLVSFLFNRFEKWPDNTAIECDESGRSYTYGELMEYAMRWGSALTRLGEGTVPQFVAMLSPNVPEYFIVLFGTLAVGSCLTTIPTLDTPAEIAHRLDDSGAAVLVVDTTLVDRAEAALKLMASGRRVTLVVNRESSRELPNLLDLISDEDIEKVNRVENSPDKVGVMLYSSGTTGLPKGVCLPHGSLTNFLPIFTHQKFFPVPEAYPGKQETSIGLLPFYHSFGLLALAASSLYLGVKIVCHPQPNPMRYAESVAKYKPTCLHLVPPLLNFLTQAPQVTQDHLASVRSVLVASAPVHPAIAKAFKRKAPQEITFLEGFGLTETLALMLTPLSHERVGCCGKLLPNMEARVEDPTTREPLGPGQPGELVVRGPCFFTHYHNNSKATAESFSADGWFRTGDVVTYSEDHFFSVVDRMKELIKVKAFQVSPTELEDLILQLEDVAEVGVVGVLDDKAGELPRAYVVLKEGQRTAPMLQQVVTKIQAHIKEKAAPYKQLAAGIVFVDELPKNPTGKLLRRMLKDQALNDTRVQF